MRGGNWKTLLERVIDVRKGKKRQQSIPRVGLRMDKLIVCNISSILFRQAVFLVLAKCWFLLTLLFPSLGWVWPLACWEGSFSLES